MARPPLPAPPPEELLQRPVHVVVRDYPETLAPLRRSGVDTKAAGGIQTRTALERAGTDGDAFGRSLATRLAWRGS